MGFVGKARGRSDAVIAGSTARACTSSQQSRAVFVYPSPGPELDTGTSVVRLMEQQSQSLPLPCTDTAPALPGEASGSPGDESDHSRGS